MSNKVAYVLMALFLVVFWATVAVIAFRFISTLG